MERPPARDRQSEFSNQFRYLIFQHVVGYLLWIGKLDFSSEKHRLLRLREDFRLSTPSQTWQLGDTGLLGDSFPNHSGEELEE